MKIHSWVVVDFSAKSDACLARKRNIYLGKVTALISDQEYEGVFVRPTFRSEGSTFSFPALEDRSIFNFGQVIGQTDDPEELRRGILKFKLNSNSW